MVAEQPMSAIERTRPWDGRPPGDAALRDGWHFIMWAGEMRAERWSPAEERWGLTTQPPIYPRHARLMWRYLGPCLTPAERDALAARLALAEGMAEALEPMARVSEVYPNARPEADVLNVHDARCVVTMADLQRARTALAAWRAAAAKETPDAR